VFENNSQDILYVKKSDLKKDISLNPIWRNIFLNEKQGNNYVAYDRKKKNKIICEFCFIRRDIVLELSVVVYNLKGFRKSLKLFCELLFNKYKEASKITVYLLSPEKLGMLFMNLCGFKKEVKVKKLYKINGKRCDYIIYSKLR